MSSNSDRVPAALRWFIDLGPVQNMAVIDLKDIERLAYSPDPETNRRPRPLPPQATGSTLEVGYSPRLRARAPVR
jgi:hypothetical protein